MHGQTYIISVLALALAGAVLTACSDPSGLTTVPTDGSLKDSTATDGTSDPSSTELLAIAGSYTDDFGSTHEISETSWEIGYAGYEPLTFAIADYSNDEQWVVAQNGPTNSYNPNQWSRFDWAWDAADDLYYCQTAYDAPDQTAAQDTPAADAADLAAGCGGFGWTALLPAGT